ncbi:hypothetical protein OJAV_G00178770 [Oryzias javanicus]|uniref:Uncharacterized protein n=1 Tax=Oryzias javanicus TaxID=123683 RepID=A0A437CC54_ORYJA|nr:hypothetical protein OJAV_G00178770 [Oryzias javanicus]
MCTGKCSKVVAVSLYVLALVSIICSIILLFPDFKTKYVSDDGKDGKPRLTPEVKYMGGLIGGGAMILVPAIHIHLTSTKGCCANRCGMFLSIGFAAVGVLGALYSLITSGLGLANGPVCFWFNAASPIPQWGAPFANSSGGYLNNKESWDWCVEPENVVEFNLGLFCTLLVVAILQGALCAIQMVNGLMGCICGTCKDDD